MLEGLKGKNVLITGGGTGIGAAVAHELSKYGAHIGIHYNKSKKKAQTLCSDLRSKGTRAHLFQGDLTKADTYRGLFRSFISYFKRIDVLVNNAGGIIGPKPFSKLDIKSWDQTVSLNLRAPFFLMREAFSYMKKNKGGKILNISSIAAKYGGSPVSLHYGAAKAGLESLTVGFARFGAPYNIFVNTVRGGVIQTDFHKKMGRKNIKNRIEKIPLKKAGAPSDIAQMVAYLASSSGNFITGQVFSVSGGD